MGRGHELLVLTFLKNILFVLYHARWGVPASMVMTPSGFATAKPRHSPPAPLSPQNPAPRPPAIPAAPLRLCASASGCPDLPGPLRLCAFARGPLPGRSQQSPDGRGSCGRPIVPIFMPPCARQRMNICVWLPACLPACLTSAPLRLCASALKCPAARHAPFPMLHSCMV
jgi:hypothetical protein